MHDIQSLAGSCHHGAQYIYIQSLAGSCHHGAQYISSPWLGAATMEHDIQSNLHERPPPSSSHLPIMATSHDDQRIFTIIYPHRMATYLLQPAATDIPTETSLAT